MDGDARLRVQVVASHEVELDGDALLTQLADGVDEHQSALAGQIAADEQDAHGVVAIVGSSVIGDRRPLFVVHPGRDDGDLVRRHLVAIDETGLGPLGPRHDGCRTGEAGPIGLPLPALDAGAARVMAVVQAELVVLQRRGIQGDDGRRPSELIGDEDGGHLGVHEHGVERPVAAEAMDGPSRPHPGAHGPVAEPRHLGGPARDGELDWRERRRDPLVGADQLAQVGGMRDVPERLLQHEPHARHGHHSSRILRAGTPATSVRFGTSDVTTAPAPTQLS